MSIATPSTEATGAALKSSLAFATRYLLIGMYFGFVLVKAEVLSWYRIQEMFRFHSFHMYGVIGLAIAVGMLTVWLIERYRLKSLDGQPIAFEPKDRSYARYALGGSLFGAGWALTGACPGPIAALIGAGLAGFTVVLAAAVLGTWTYGLLRQRLPH